MSYKKQREQDLKKSKFPLQIIFLLVALSVSKFYGYILSCLKLKHPDMIV